MIVKAIELAENGKGVLFLVFVGGRHNGSEKKTLLCLDLEEKFKNHPKIKVQMVPFVNGKTDNLKDINLAGITHVMMDEFFWDFHSFQEETKAEVRNFIKEMTTVWIAMCNSYQPQNRLPAEVDDKEKLEEFLKRSFPPGFQVAKMDKPLRSPLSVTKDLKNQVERAGGVSQLALNDRFLLDSKVPSNMADGSSTGIGNTKIELLGQLSRKHLRLSLRTPLS